MTPNEPREGEHVEPNEGEGGDEAENVEHVEPNDAPDEPGNHHEADEDGDG